MIALQTVYLTAEGKAVPAGDSDARVLLVREGCDLPDSAAARHEGAATLAKKEASAKPAPAMAPAQRNGPQIELEDDDEDEQDENPVQTRKPKTVNRDPKKLRKR